MEVLEVVNTKGKDGRTFGQRHRYLRRQGGWSIREETRHTHVASSTIVAWEHDRRKPEAGPQARAVARFFRVSVGWLLDGEPPMD